MSEGNICSMRLRYCDFCYCMISLVQLTLHLVAHIFFCEGFGTQSSTEVSLAMNGDMYISVCKQLSGMCFVLLFYHQIGLGSIGMGPNPNMGPWSDKSSHHTWRSLLVEAPVALSAYQTWWTSGHRNLSWSMRGVIARAYMDIAEGSLCVVPSVDWISLLPVMKSLTGAL